MCLFEFIKNIDSTTLVLFDVNETLVTYSDNYRIFRQTNSKNLVKMKNLIKREKFNFLHVLDNMFDVAANNIMLVDQVLPNIINNLKSRGIPCFAFTAIRTGQATCTSPTIVEEKWSEILSDMAITFDNSFDTTFDNTKESDIIKASRILPLDKFYINQGAKIHNGIIYSNNINKGYIFKLFIQHIANNFPETYNKITKIIMIDDSQSNLDSMEKYTELYNDEFNTSLDFVGYHYTKVEDNEKLLRKIDDDYIRQYVDNL